jgi:hypothetical protein
MSPELARLATAGEDSDPSRAERKVTMAGLQRAPEDLEAQVRRVTQTLKTQRRGDAADEVIERTVRDCFDERKDARIKDFVSLLAERAARERLRQRSGTQPAGSATG